MIRPDLEEVKALAAESTYKMRAGQHGNFVRCKDSY